MSDAPQMIFVNLPVKDLERSKTFFAALGFTPNLINRPIGDAHKQAQVILALSSPSRAAVDATVEKALAAGGTEPTEARDYGFMYQRSFADPDGHLWEVAHMDGEPG